MNSAFDISGLTAVITGGGRGLGLGITTALLDAGVDVHVISRRPPDESVVVQAVESGRRLIHHEADLSDREALPVIAEQILSDRWDRHSGQYPGTQNANGDRASAESFDWVMTSICSVLQACQLGAA